jgi:hypothetical protein
MLNVTELFSEETERLIARKKLNQTLTGGVVRLGGKKFVKLSNESVTELDDEVKIQASPEGAEELEWVGRLIAAFGSRLRMVRMEHDGQYVLHEVNTNTKEVHIANVPNVVATMRDFIGSALSFHKADAAVRRTLDRMQCMPSLVIPEHAVAPLLLADVDANTYTYKRLSLSSTPTHTEPRPLTDLLNLVVHEEGKTALKLWLGSILDPETTRIQYLCLYGGGRNGKSTLLDALANLFGSSALAMTSSSFMSRFGLSSAANKRLMIFDDNNNAAFMSSGDFKRLTGSSTLSVERKGKDKIDVKNNVKVIIATNRLPRLHGDGADLRRNLFVQMHEFRGTSSDKWTKEFSAAMPDIMRYCYTLFQAHKLATGSSLIPEVVAGKDIIEQSSVTAEADELIYGWFTDSPTTLEREHPATPEWLRKRLQETKAAKEVVELVKDALLTRYGIGRLDDGKRTRYYKNLFIRCL